MGKKNWFFTILSVLFGGMVASPGPGGAALRGQLGRVGGNLWTRLQQVGQDIANALGNAGTAIRWRIHQFVARLRMIMYLMVASWIAVIGSALLPHQWAQNVVPIIMLVSLGLFVWLLMTGFSLGVILAGAAKLIVAGRIVGRFAPRINPLLDEFEKIAKKILRDLRIFVGIQLLAGLYLAIVPISNDRLLLPLLAVAFAAAACFVGVSGKIVKGISVLIAILTLIFFLGGRNNATAEIGRRVDQVKGLVGASSSPAPSISPVRTDLDCRDDQGHRKEVHQYEAFAKANFVQSFQVGCSTLMVMPRIYGYHWHMQPVADDPNQRRWFYAKEVGGPWRGPFLLGSDANMRFDRSPVPVTFYIQPAAGQSGDFKVDFGTDLILPAMPEPEAKTAPMEQVEPSVEPERIYNPDEDGVVGPQPITRVEPNYTDEARRKKIMGVVIVNCVIDKDGSTRDFEIVQSLGFGLDEQAIHAVSRWRFAPATKDGVPVPIHGQISVRFKLI